MKTDPDRNGRVLNAMTVDVEEHFQVSAFEGVVRREDWSSLPSRVEESTKRLLDLFDEKGIQATFFVLGWVAERKPGLVRDIAERGHEVASHGYSHRLIYEQQPEEFLEELRASRQLLQDASGQPVLGHRAASFSIGRGNLWALDKIVEAGFTYDSSLFPVVHDRYGIPGAPRGLYRVETPSGATLVEAPPSTLALGRFNLPIAGGGYLRLYPTVMTRWAVGRLNRREGMPGIVYVHPWEVDPEQPRMNGVSWGTRVRHYIGLGGTLGKLGALAEAHAFSTLGQVIEQAGELPVERFDGVEARQDPAFVA